MQCNSNIKEEKETLPQLPSEIWSVILAFKWESHLKEYFVWVLEQQVNDRLLINYPVTVEQIRRRNYCDLTDSEKWGEYAKLREFLDI